MRADDDVAEPVAVRVTEQQRELIDALAAELDVEADEAVRYGFDAFLRQGT